MEAGDATTAEEAQRPREGAGPVLATLERLREDVAELARRIAAIPDQRSLEARVEALSEGVAALRRSTLTAEEGQRLLARVDNLGGEVAARVGVDAAVAALGVRLGAVGSALDQARITLLDAFAAASEPDWAVALRTRLEALLTEAAGEPAWVRSLRSDVDDISDAVSAEPAWAAGLRARLDAILGDTGPEWALALRSRLEAIEDRPVPVDTTGTELIAAAVEELSRRLDSDIKDLTKMLSRSMSMLIERVDRIESEQAQQTAAAHSRAEVAAARLESLRAERQQVSAQLEEERRRYREAIQP